MITEPTSDDSLEKLAAAAASEDALHRQLEEVACARCGFKKKDHPVANYAEFGPYVRICPTATFDPVPERR